MPSLSVQQFRIPKGSIIIQGSLLDILQTHILVDHLEESDAYGGVVLVVDVHFWRSHGHHLLLLRLHHLAHQVLHVVLHLLLAPEQAQGERELGALLF